MNITVLDAATLGDDLDLSVLSMDEKHKLTVYPFTAPEEVGVRLRAADIAVVNKIKINETNLPVCADDPSRSPLKLICITATGYDNIDLTACRKLGIGVCNVVGYSSDSVAQITAGIVLSLVNHLPEYSGFVKNGDYTRGGCANMLVPVFHELRGKTWGILGLGRIGRQTARIAEALGCRVIGTRRGDDPEYRTVDIDTLCRESDILTVHVPLNDATRDIINRERLCLMKRDAILVNMARGAVTDEAAVADAVLEGRLAGFGADVYSVEPIPADHPYMKICNMNNVCLTPHMSWGAYEARVRCIEEIAENIRSFENGDTRCRVDLI